jgi:hypothetical protein
MKTNTTTPRTFRGLTVIALAFAALGLSQPAVQAGIIISDDTVKLSAGGGQNDATVVGQWTSAKGSAPVDAANDLLKNHATMSMASGGAGLGSTAYINDGLMLSNGKTSDSTDGVCLYTSSGSWTGSGPVDVVFTLDAAYNVGRIDGFTLWDLSRLGQKYDLYASTDSGASWNLVTSVSQDATGSDGNRHIRRISLTDFDGVITGLAGVNALKFHIMDPGPGGTSNFNNNSIYAEIAAYALVLADAANSTVVAAPTSVASDGTTTSTISVTLRDASNNPVVGKTVTLASNRAEGVDTISAASGPSSSSGVVTFTVSSSTSGPVIFTATDVSDGNLVISPSTATVTFQAGAVSTANSTVAAAPSSVPADGSATSTIVVTLKDASGTAVWGKTVELVSSRGTPPDTISPTSGVTNPSGVVAFAVSSATAGDATFTATGDSVPITQTAPVTFTPGPVAAGTSTVTASPATATADGIATSTITVTLMDANSNRVEGKDVSLVSDRGTPPDTILPTSGNTSNANGVATFTVSSATVGSPVFTATGDGVPITATATVSFVYAPPVTDTTVQLLASGESDSQVVAKWTAAQGSAPVDTVNDLLKNHATVAMTAGNVAAGLGCSLANINDGLQVSKLTDSNTDGMCLFTNNGGWPSSGPADLVFTLDAHYDIARIDSFTLWDPSRTGQKYDLYGSTDNGASWTFVTSVNKDSGAEGPNRDLRRISLTNAGGVIPGLVGVNALKFHIMDPGPNGAMSNNSIFAEIAAYEVIHGGTSNYASWATTNGFDPLHPEAVGNDGLTNLLVYALALKTNGTNGSPGTLTGNMLSFAKRPDAVTNNDVTYAIETSPNLQNPWTTTTTGVTDNSTAISIDLSTLIGTSYFARLKVTHKP